MIDKGDWGPGPWQGEPDDLAWYHAGLLCEIHRSAITGGLCGYVRLPQGHRFHGLTWQRLTRVLRVHGGITLAEIGDSGRYWIGFDCAHAWDDLPALRARIAEGMLRRLPEALCAELALDPANDLLSLFGEYRPFPYVRAQTEGLAEQLAAPRYRQCELCAAPKRTWARQAFALCVRCSRGLKRLPPGSDTEGQP